MGVGIREDVDAVVSVDRANLAARVARQARVPSRMEVAGAYGLTHREAGLHRYFSARRFTLRDRSRNGTRNKRGRGLGRAWRRLAALNFLASDQLAFDHQLDERVQPLLVVAHTKIFGCRNKLNRVTGGI